jgi:hypothetical protein
MLPVPVRHGLAPATADACVGGAVGRTVPTAPAPTARDLPAGAPAGH